MKTAKPKKPPKLLDDAPVPPATCPFSEVADDDGVVSLNLPIGASNDSVVSAINIKIFDPNNHTAHTADFTVHSSKMKLEDLLFGSGANPFVGDGPLSTDNRKDTASVDDCPYFDDCTCVIPLEPPCNYGDSQEAFKLSKTLKGGVFQVVATLYDYKPKQRVDGTIVLVRD
jgi:hypothetical protein